jgi:hypothetical protein
MKYIILLFVLLLTAIANSEEFHSFTNEQGRIVKARLLKYDGGSGRIQLELSSGKKMWVSPKFFSPEDQAYIQGWVRAEPFRNTASLRILVTKQEEPWKTTGKVGFSGDLRKEKRISYTLNVKNNSRIDLKKLRMEYLLFRAKKDHGYSYVESKFYKKNIGDILANEKKEISAVKNRSYKSPGTDTEDEIIGVCIRIYMPVSEGNEVMREIRYPNSLSAKKYPWKLPRKKSLGERYRRKK